MHGKILDGETGTGNILIPEIWQCLGKLFQPLRIGSRDFLRCWTSLPDAQQPDPVKTQLGEVIQFSIGNIVQSRVLALTVGQAKQPLFEDRVVAVPEGQAEAEVLLVVGDAGDAILAPAIGAGPGLFVGEEIPGITVRTVVLPDRSPLSFTEVRPPFLPGGSYRACIVQPFLLGNVAGCRLFS